MFADLNGARLHYEVSGTGEPVILIGGFGTNAAFWEHARTLLDGYRVVTYDNRGVGDTVYEGEFRAGLRNGYGVQTTADSVRYEGQWRDDKRHGRGKLTWGNDGANCYDGTWADDRQEGTGVLILEDGTKYKGGFKDGLEDGKGVRQEPDGTRYEGFFRRGKKDGPFVEFDKDGKLLRRGTYKNGYLDQAAGEQ